MPADAESCVVVIPEREPSGTRPVSTVASMVVAVNRPASESEAVLGGQRRPRVTLGDVGNIEAGDGGHGAGEVDRGLDARVETREGVEGLGIRAAVVAGAGEGGQRDDARGDLPGAPRAVRAHL